MTELVSNFWQLFLVSAPWLLLGLILAGLINVFIPKDFLQRHLGKEGFWVTVKAALIGAPMPLCSCGVIPAAIGLRRAGGSKSATTAFLVSTPETGVDSISVSYALLGPFMAVIRPIAAVSSAIVAGLLVGKESEMTKAHKREVDSPKSATDSSCCAKPVATTKNSCCDTSTTQENTSCSNAVVSNTSCCDEPQPPTESSCCETVVKSSEQSCCASKAPLPTVTEKLKQALHFSSNKLLSDTAVWLLIGLFFAALVQTFVPASFLSQWGNGIVAMLAVILISIPMYICATASTPIAVGLLLAGVSPGAVLVFMLAGPATNVATIGVVANELGKRAVAAYLIGVIGVALIFGFFTDYLVTTYGFVVSPMMGEEHEVLPEWFVLLCGVMLAGLLIRLAFINTYKLFSPKIA
ncbi:SO_0444 family Cu/Zn efflux transporter [Pseudoalteromonas sp. T1lg65]|uniref:SO_0444 family Cu/Zn efflux transporter n=1 Tax=Pseudoalteromonas sp. T1lg65 TaxID=2077101 RepID=UPI003F79C9BF